MSTTSGPLSRVLEALAAGAATRVELRRRTGLTDDLVDAVLTHLQRSGQLSAFPTGGCPSSGCGACGSGRADGQAGCGAASPATASGPVALTLRTRRPE